MMKSTKLGAVFFDAVFVDKKCLLGVEYVGNNVMSPQYNNITVKQNLHKNSL